MLRALAGRVRPVIPPSVWPDRAARRRWNAPSPVERVFERGVEDAFGSPLNATKPDRQRRCGKELAPTVSVVGLDQHPRPAMPEVLRVSIRERVMSRHPSLGSSTTIALAL